ncbi:MAG: CinA family nicotinamide mononucleotide deamidase-related protein [Pirellulales bacterium]|nr:CinA family nicotinamide mononucleotide deamidase-related protein [Pirellulales bacterium]
MHAEILAVGDEIVSGQTLDTNSQWLSQRLAELGVRVLYHGTVGDELEPCRQVFRQAIDRAEIVIVTGGLGPTADDLTRQALATAVGRELVVFPEALEHIRARFARRNWPMPPQNEVQALFPAGSRMIPNPHGTAPGIDLEVPRPDRPPCRFFALPGVPGEMKEMWPTVAEAISPLPDHCVVPGEGQGVRANRVILRRKINCFGAGESRVESMLPDLIRRGRQPTVGITASKTTISLRITAEGATEAECQAAIEPVVETIHQCLGELVFGEGDEELQHAVVKLLREKNKTLATVEFGTGGLLAELLSAVPNAEGCYRGGVVLRDPSQMKNALGIDPGGQTFLPDNNPGGQTFLSDISSSGGQTFLSDKEETGRNACPPEEWLKQAAKAARQKFQVDCVLAVGPFPHHRPDSSLPVDLLVDLAGTVESKTVPFLGHPDWVKVFMAKQALNLLRLNLRERG